jgi:hypothetical protein
MQTSLQPARGAGALTRVDRVQGVLLDQGSLAAIASELAGRQAAKLTREAYAGVYRDAEPELLHFGQTYRQPLEQQLLCVRRCLL